MQKQTNYRGKVLSQLINLRDSFKENNKVAEGYVSGIIDDVMEGWKKEESSTK